MLVAATGVEAAAFDALTTGKVIRHENRGDVDRNAATMVVELQRDHPSGAHVNNQ